MAYKATGFGQIASLSSVKTLANAGSGIPANTGAALVQAEAQDVRWTADGTTPTATVGMLLKANDSLWYDLALADLKLIEAASGAKLNVTFYGSP